MIDYLKYLVRINRTWRHWGHWILNELVLRCGDWPIVGRIVWWAFGNWQHFM
jgi:hypothetical protein